MAKRIEESYPDHPPVEDMFPPERLDSIDTSDLVRSMTPKDLHEMEIAFNSMRPSKNPKVQKITSHDLQSLENLFAEYRQAVIANYKGIDSLIEPVAAISAARTDLVAAGSSCCCCCTPCCSCSSAASEVEPFEA